MNEVSEHVINTSKHSNVHNSTHNEPSSCINALARIIIRPEVHKRPTLHCVTRAITTHFSSFLHIHMSMSCNSHGIPTRSSVNIPKWANLSYLNLFNVALTCFYASCYWPHVGNDSSCDVVILVLFSDVNETLFAIPAVLHVISTSRCSHGRGQTLHLPEAKLRYESMPNVDRMILREVKKEVKIGSTLASPHGDDIYRSSSWLFNVTFTSSSRLFDQRPYHNS